MLFCRFCLIPSHSPLCTTAKGPDGPRRFSARLSPLLVVFTPVRFFLHLRRLMRRTATRQTTARPAAAHLLTVGFHAAALLVLLLWVGRAQALERITLRNGFSYDCARREPLDGARVRLYLANDAPSAQPSNYVDVPADAVEAIESLPDPPNAAKASSTATQPGSGVADIRGFLAHAGAVHDIDIDLLASVMHAESGGRATVLSRAGAVGLMPLMPATALALGVADPLRPEQNIAGGTAYLDALLTRYKNNLALALAAYNAGPAAVDRYHGIPPFRETRAYVVRVMTEFKRRKLALEPTTLAAR